MLTAINYMRRSYAAESKWNKPDNDHHFSSRPALAEDDYDLNRSRYLKKLKKMTAAERAAYFASLRTQSLKYEGFSTSA